MLDLENKIVHVPVGQLRPSPTNARRHSNAQFKRIAKSIDKLGFLGTILITPDKIIISGEGRWLATKFLGRDTIPCLIVSHLTQAELRAYAIADNQLAALAGWDFSMLSAEFSELRGKIDLDLTGFDHAEIDAIQFDVAERKTSTPDIDEYVPNPRSTSPTSQSGDMWKLGRHFAIQGDAKDPKTYAGLMWGPKATAAFLDPPYNLPARMISGNGKSKHPDFFEASGEMSDSQYVEFLFTVLSRVVEYLIAGAVCFVMCDWRHLREMFAAGDAVFSELLNLCFWMKNNAGMGSMYRSQHELVLVWKYAKAAHLNNIQLGSKGRNRSNVWQYRGANSFGADRATDLKSHPTAKPVAMVMDAIRDVTKRGDVVIDAFGGSGTTLIAAEKTGRVARIIEIDPYYCDVIIRRYQNMTGESVYLAGTNKTFEEVQIERNIKEKFNG